MAKRIYIGVFIGGLVILGIYYLLGGFQSVVVQNAEKLQFKVIGRYFYGEYDDRSVRSYFVQARELVTSGRLEGQLCVVTYQPDSLQEDFIAQFIGVAINDEAALPDGFEQRSFEGSKAAVANLDMHPVAMPNPKTVQTELISYAQSQGWSKPQSFIEIYLPDNSMQVYILSE